jgi:hypothetical protein
VLRKQERKRQWGEGDLADLSEEEYIEECDYFSVLHFLPPTGRPRRPLGGGELGGVGGAS